MKILKIIIICTAAIAKSKCAQDDGDTGKPYEFGFTIDGEQHRYEKKDANGIIQGEFGFITADGIYHVTTYATDEKGSFRILSMRNVRISDPLDGSGGTYSNKVPASSVQGAGKIPQKPQQQLLSHQQLQQTTPPTHQNQVSSSTTTTPRSSVNQITQATTRRAQINFTLQSTALPACASCGYVTRPTSTNKPVTQFVQSHRPLQNEIFTASLSSSEGSSSKTTTASPFVFSSTTTQTFNVDIPQTHPLPISQSILSPAGPPHPPQSANKPSQISTFESSHSLTPAKPSVPSSINTSQFTPETPSQFVEPPAFSPQHPQIQSNVDTFNPPSVSVPLSSTIQPNGPPQSHQPLKKPCRTPCFKPSQSISPELPTLPSPIGSTQFTPDTFSQFVQPPSFNPQQPQVQPNVDTFHPISESISLLPTVPVPEVPAIPNDKVQLPVNTFARPPINNQPEFDKITPPISALSPSRVDNIKVENGMIYVPNNSPIKIQDKYPGMVDGLPEGVEQKDIMDLLYKFNYTIGFHGHYEKGWRNGTKIGGYFVNGRDGISRVVTYVADEYGYRPKFRLINLGLDSPDTPKVDTEKKFGLKSFEFVWYPLK